MQDLIDLETQGWQALSSEGEVSQKFYHAVLCEDAVMLFPSGMVVDGKDSILKSLATQPWESFEIQEPRVISLSENAATLIYRVTAQRQGSSPYIALINSTYILRDGAWKLILHQQTPA